MQNLHFICTGNIYRSRMAEAYVNSLPISHVHASSSGLEAAATKLEVSPYAIYATKHFGVEAQLTSHKSQTNEAAIRGADILIFMSGDVYDSANAIYDFSGKKYEVWNIEDLGVQYRKITELPQDTVLACLLALDTFTLIRSRTDTLIAKIFESA